MDSEQNIGCSGLDTKKLIVSSQAITKIDLYLTEGYKTRPNYWYLAKDTESGAFYIKCVLLNSKETPVFHMNCGKLDNFIKKDIYDTDDIDLALRIYNICYYMKFDGEKVEFFLCAGKSSTNVFPIPINSLFLDFLFYINPERSLLVEDLTEWPNLPKIPDIQDSLISGKLNQVREFMLTDSNFRKYPPFARRRMVTELFDKYGISWNH